MTPWTAVAAGGAALLAAAAAAADGALRATERAAMRAAVPTAAVPDAARVRPADGESPAAANERAHRVLAFARLLGHLCVGVLFGLAARSAGGDALTIGLAVVASLLIVLVAETAARAIGEAQGERALGPLRPVVRLLELALLPVDRLAAAVDRPLARSLPSPKTEELEREATAEQFRQVVASEAEVTRDEAFLLRGVFSLTDTEVHEVMVPRVDVVGISADTRWSEVLDRVRSSEHSRFPVYDDTLDDVIGLLHAKDLLPAIVADDEPAAGWRSLLRPPTFIPRTKKIADQLRDFRSSQSHIAVVADEFGGMAGVVTIEDVLEEIVGEIRDETDEEEPEVETEGGDRFWVSARLTLEELSERLGADFEREGITTVGGLVYDHLGRVPRPGETFVLGGFRVVVERVVRRKVQRVYFERTAALDAASADDEDGA